MLDELEAISGTNPERLLVKALERHPDKRQRVERLLSALLDKFPVHLPLWDTVQRWRPFTAAELGAAQDSAVFSSYQLLTLASIRPDLFEKNLVARVRAAQKELQSEAVSVTDEEPLPELPNSVYAAVDVSGMVRQAVAILSASGTGQRKGQLVHSVRLRHV